MKKLTIILGIVICLLIIGITSTFAFSNNRDKRYLKIKYACDNRNYNGCLNLERHHGNGNGHHYRFNR